MRHPENTPAGLVAVVTLLAIFLPCCAPKQPPAEIPRTPAPEQTAQPEPPPPDYTALYDELTVLENRYRAGVELVAAGEEVLGESRMAEASVGMEDLASECARSAGCDLTRFIETFNRLLSEQGLAVKQQANRITTLEANALADVEREPGTSAFARVMPEIGRTESLLRGTDLREIISLNGPVNAALDDWLTWMRPLLMDSYENYQYLRSQVAPVYEEAELPEALLFAMIATETGGKVHSFSRAGAAGPLQFMSYTGRQYGLRVEDGFDMRLDPAAATRANVGYLNDRFEELNGSLEKALAAYNGGENRVRNLNRRLRGISLWDTRMYYSLPEETREYVPRILAAAWLFMHPEEYNLEFPVYETDTTRMTLQQEIALGELTICLGQTGNRDGWFRTLRNLNPRLSPGERLKVGQEIVIPTTLVEPYEERCLEGEFLERSRVLHDANYPDEPEMIPYIVRRGDTLGRIANRHRCVSVGRLAEINRIRPPKYVIRVGQQLKIPRC